jgi:hypothetical protein
MAIPDALRGRAGASMQVLTRGAGPIGALLAGALGGAIGVRQTILIGVIGVAASSGWLLASPVRSVREGRITTEAQRHRGSHGE